MVQFSASAAALREIKYFMSVKAAQPNADFITRKSPGIVT